MTTISTTPYPASRLQFLGITTDEPAKYVQASLWPDLEIGLWQLLPDGTGAFPAGPAFAFQTIISNPGNDLTLWSDGTDLFFGATMLGGGGSTPTYTNATPTPDALGGIPAGSTFVAQTMQQMFDALLYPYQTPSFGSFAITGETSPLEVGDSIAASVTFTWTTTNPTNIPANSIDIMDVTLGVPLAVGLANDGTQLVNQGAPVTNSAVASHVYEIESTDTQSDPFSRTLTFNWRWRAFWGVGSFVVPTEAQIEALATNGLTSVIAGTYVMGAGNYKYICVSNAIGGQINDVKDSATLLSVPMATTADNAAYSNVDGGGTSYALVSVTNGFGVTNNYRVYRTANSLGSSITLLVT